MAVFMVGHDLHDGEDYKDLMEAIAALSSPPGAWHCLDSTWFIIHDGPAISIRDALKPHLINPDKEKGDKLLVARMQGEWASTLAMPEDCLRWLKSPKQPFGAP